MTNHEYVKSLLTNNEKIYIDTSSLMNVTEFTHFIEKYDELFKELKTKIIVSREVCLEIVKHLISHNAEKQNKAKLVIKLLREHTYLFIFDDNDFKKTEVTSAFADSELLSRITKDKIKYTQLLITNDKKLSVDAYSLNTLNSCKGKKVMVCFINNSGQLNKGKTSFELKSDSTERPQKVEEEQVDLSDNQTEHLKNIQQIILGACLLTLGFAIGKINSKSN